MALFFKERPWSLDSLTPPWGQLPSIYEHLRTTPDSQLLPDQPLVRKRGTLKWAAGAWDGVVGHHVSRSDSTKAIFQILTPLQSLLQRPKDKALAVLYERVAQDSILAFVDQLLSELERSRAEYDAQRLHEVGRYFVTRSAHREAVKFGMALLGLVGDASDSEVLKILGRNEEFTLYAAVALLRVAADPERALWDLARSVHGWGRIHLVERLKGTQNLEIQSWLLREGFRNTIMNEYLACICARTGRLHDVLKQKQVDDALLDATADIIQALITGGPAEGIDDYSHAPQACEAYIDHVWARPNIGLKHFIAVAALRDFLTSPDGWERRQERGWTEERRFALKALCDNVFGREAWRRMTLDNLSSGDSTVFAIADQAAEILAIDTWDMHFARVQTAPLTSHSWYRLMKQTDHVRIDRVLAFAESVIPFVQIETGPANEIGLGPGFEPHHTLDWIVQDLGRFPGHGWRLIRAGLQSPVERNRCMAARALSAWPRESWPSDAFHVLQRAHDREPDEDIRCNLAQILNPEPKGR